MLHYEAWNTQVRSSDFVRGVAVNCGKRERIVTRKYKVVSILTNDKEIFEKVKEEYSERTLKETEEYPHLRSSVRDEQDLFVIDPETEDWWPAEEFFYHELVQEFTVNKEGEPIL